MCLSVRIYAPIAELGNSLWSLHCQLHPVLETHPALSLANHRVRESSLPVIPPASLALHGEFPLNALATIASFLRRHGRVGPNDLEAIFLGFGECRVDGREQSNAATWLDIYRGTSRNEGDLSFTLVIEGSEQCVDLTSDIISVPIGDPPGYIKAAICRRG